MSQEEPGGARMNDRDSSAPRVSESGGARRSPMVSLFSPTPVKGHPCFVQSYRAFISNSAAGGGQDLW